MSGYRSILGIGVFGVLLSGCELLSRSIYQPDPAGRPALLDPRPSPTSGLVQASYSAQEKDGKELLPNPRGNEVGDARSVELSELISMTLERNPRLAQVGWAVDKARGQALQAGLYPNPTLSVSGNEISDRTGPSGIWSAGASQEIVTANKLGLSRAAVSKEVDQATLNLMAERYRVFADVRETFFDVVALQRRVDILRELVELAQQSVANAERLLKAKEAARLDVVQMEVDLERYQAELEATQRALPAAYRKLAANVGQQQMSISRVIGDLDLPLPDLDFERVRLYVLSVHPEIQSAQVGVERAKLLLKRAEVEPIPNVTVGTGYVYQGQNRSNDWDIGVSLPVPLWNKNQGNILAARAQVSEAVSQVARTQNDVVNRLATAYSTYISARKRVGRYKSAILPKAVETLQLSRKAYQGGQFEYLRVLAAQRAVGEANLELLRSLGEMWRAASEISGLMLEDQWPPSPTAPPEERKQP